MQFLIFGTLWFYISVSISIALVFYFLESALTVDYKDVGGGYSDHYNQPIKRTFKFMYSSFEKLFSQMSTSMFSDLQKKVEEKNKIKEEERERMLNGKRRKKDQNEI